VLLLVVVVKIDNDFVSQFHGIGNWMTVNLLLPAACLANPLFGCSYAQEVLRLVVRAGGRRGPRGADARGWRRRQLTVTTRRLGQRLLLLARRLLGARASGRRRLDGYLLLLLGRGALLGAGRRLGLEAAVASP